MRETNPNLIDDTLAVWQPRVSRRLSREDAREIHENLVGFFRVLQEWSAREQATADPSPGAELAVCRQRRLR